MQNYTFYKVTTNTVQNSCTSNIDSERWWWHCPGCNIFKILCTAVRNFFCFESNLCTRSHSSRPHYGFAESNIPSLFNNFLSNSLELILSFISTSRVTKPSFRIIVSKLIVAVLSSSTVKGPCKAAYSCGINHVRIVET